MYRIIIQFVFVITFLVFTGCNYEAPEDNITPIAENNETNTTSSDNNTNENNTTENNVTSNVQKTGTIDLVAATYVNLYDSNSSDEDILMLFFSRPLISENSAPINIADAFKIDGNGAIGSNSIWNVRYSVFFEDNKSASYSFGIHSGSINYNTLQIFDGGTENKNFLVGDKIAKSTIGLLDENGNASSEDSPYVEIDMFNFNAHVNSGSDVCLKIEDIEDSDDKNISTISCNDEDAIKSEFSLNKSIGLSINGNTTQDSVTRLIWQTSYSNVEMDYNSSFTYCDELGLDGIDKWRVPSLAELETIVDRSSDSNVIKPYFNFTDRYYWSSDSFVLQDEGARAWAMDYVSKINTIQLQSEKLYVRCVADY